MADKQTKGLFTKMLKNDKMMKIIVIVGICGIALIYLSSFLSPAKEEVADVEEDSVFSVDSYEDKLEKDLQRIVTALTGEESPEIMVTLETLNKYVYASDEKNKLLENEEFEGGEKKGTQNSTDVESKYIIIKDASGAEHALKVTEIQPEIKGVVVVSKYADNVLVREKITNAVKAVLNISSSKVCVLGAK